MKKQALILFFCLSVPLSSGYDVAPNGADINLQNNENINNNLPFESSAIDLITTRQAFEILNNKNTLGEEIETNCSTMYTLANVNIRAEGNMDAEILYVLPFNSEIIAYYNDCEWTKVTYGEYTGWVNSKYISFSPCEYTEYSIPSNRGFKSYMSYKAITKKNSPQYLLQNNYSYTGNYGIRQVNGRYCVALGTAFNAKIGTYFDLILENEVTIPCILGDVKANVHTKKDNITTAYNGCVSEFIVDTSVLYNKAKTDGNISSCREEWDSPVAAVRIYDKNIFN